MSSRIEASPALPGKSKRPSAPGFLPTNRLVLGSSALYALERFFASLVAFFVFVVLTRSYAPDVLGRYSYAIAVIQLAAPFLASGIEPVVVQTLIQAAPERDRILGSAAFVVGLASTLAALLPLAYIWAAFGPNTPVGRIAMLAALAFAPGFLLVIEHALRVDARALPIVTARVTATLVGASIKVWLAFDGAALQTLALALPFEAALHAALLTVFARGSTRVSTWRISGTRARAVLRAGAPLVASTLLVTFFFRLNYALMANASTFTEVGYYALAFNVLVIAATLPNMLMTGLFPWLVRLAQADRARFEVVIARLLRVAAIAGYLAFALAWLLGPWIIPAVFGAKYGPASDAVALALLACVFAASGSVRACVINVDGRYRYHYLSALIGLAVLVPAAVLLIPGHGARGAAAAIAVGCLGSGVLSSFAFGPLRPYARWQILALLLIPFAPRAGRH